MFIEEFKKMCCQALAGIIIVVFILLLINLI